MNKWIGTRNKARARRVGIAITVLALALLAIPYVGFGGRTAAPPTINAGQGAKVASVSTARGSAALYTAPATNGYECVTISVPDSAVGSLSNSQFGNGGAECHPGADAAKRLTGAQLTTSMNWVTVADSNVALVIEGRAGSAIQRVEVHLGDGTVVPAALSSTAAGYYVSRINAPAVGKLPGDVTVVGYNAGGRELTSVDLQDVLAAATP